MKQRQRRRPKSTEDKLSNYVAAQSPRTKDRKSLIGFAATPQQIAWLENRAAETGESMSAVLRGLVDVVML